MHGRLPWRGSFPGTAGIPAGPALPAGMPAASARRPPPGGRPQSSGTKQAIRANAREASRGTTWLAHRGHRQEASLLNATRVWSATSDSSVDRRVTVALATDGGDGYTFTMTRPPLRFLLVALLVLVLAVALYVLAQSVRQHLLPSAPPHRPTMQPTTPTGRPSVQPATRAGFPGPLAASAAVDYCLNGGATATGPADAYTLPVSQRDQLQSALNTYHGDRLQAGNYQGSLSGITISSNQQLFGWPNYADSVASAVPPITVAPGTTNAVVDDVGTPVLTFPASGQMTSQNCFMRVRHYTADTGSIEMDGATLDSNVFLGNLASLHADDSRGGALTN